MSIVSADYKPYAISDNHERGLILETVLLHAERELGLDVIFHNDLSPREYPKSSGVGLDNIFQHKGLSYGVECKNLKGYVGQSFGKRHIVERYEGRDVDKKLVVVSKSCLLSTPLRILLYYLGFIILDVGFQVDWDNFSKAVHILRRQLRQLLHIPTLSLDECLVSSVFDSNCMVCSSYCSVNSLIDVVLGVYCGLFDGKSRESMNVEET